MATSASKLKQMTAQLQQETAAADAYQAALTAPAKTQAQVDTINTGVQTATVASGNVYDPTKELTVNTQPSLNPIVQTTQNFATGSKPVNTLPVAPPVNTLPVAPPASTLTNEQKDAYALLEDTFKSYGLESLVPVIKGYMQQNMGPNQAVLALKGTPEYQARFAGNTARVAAGLNALSEGDYLTLENSYATQMTAYGQGALANKAQFANLIGNDISATELKDRLDLAVTQVQQADPTVMASLKSYYPSITDANLVSYFLNPADTLPMLNRQVQAADIGAAATQQGLTTNKIAAEGLAAYGTTYAQAQAGYGKIAEVLPASQRLSAIYGRQTGINYNQAEGEAQYLKNSGAAALEQQKLKDLEAAQFSGRSGVLGANVAAGYSGSLGKSIQGSF